MLSRQAVDEVEQLVGVQLKGLPAVEMDARAFAVIVFLLSTTVAGAQPRPARVGVLVPELGRSQLQSIKGLREGLKQLGFVEGQSLILETRDGKGDRGNLRPLATELVTQKVNVLLTTGTRATQLAKEATREIPIVFIHPADPVSLGLVESIERPGPNVTGVAGFALQMTARRLEISKEIVPGLQRLQIFYDANNKVSRENFDFARAAAGKAGLQVLEYGVKSAEELKATVAGIQNRNGDVIFYVPDDLVESEAEFLITQARQKKIPTIFDGEGWAIKGAMAVYGPSFYEMGRQAARLVEAIMKGRAPETLPVQQAGKFDLILNNRTATFVGITFSRETLKKADRVIR
jgi:putative ABC transport system substrate-binding protein